MTKVIRVFGIIMCVGGLYMIFTPIILLLKWIPLIGALLGAIASFAAFLLALIVGLTLSFFRIAIAWIIFRPFVALSLLTLAGIGSYFLFFWTGGAIV